jgi:hypothetical protein
MKLKLYKKKNTKGMNKNTILGNNVMWEEVQ